MKINDAKQFDPFRRYSPFLIWYASHNKGGFENLMFSLWFAFLNGSFVFLDMVWPNNKSPHYCEHNMSLRFSFVLLFSLTVTFFCSRNFSITVTRNVWVGYSVCLCVMKYRNHTVWWMVEEGATLKMVWQKGW